MMSDMIYEHQYRKDSSMSGRGRRRPRTEDQSRWRRPGYMHITATIHTVKTILIEKYVVMLVVVLQYFRGLGSRLFGDARSMENATI